uniref:Myb/SANT-like DNA-binding domain-containing protein n=1 Tax=Monopterus albus TaxID=43700 RepID=A0A3Q3IDP8_MONAL
MESGQWKDGDVHNLSTWGENAMQAKLEGSYRNRAVFESVSKEMAERGHSRTWIQCQREVKNLRAKFKETKDLNKRSGHGRVTCPFYDELDHILGDKPSCQPIELLDSCSTVSAEEVPESPGIRRTSRRRRAQMLLMASPPPAQNCDVCRISMT